MTSHKHIIIIGGGFCGLSAAYTLQEEARAKDLPLSCTLLEADARLGGKILTERVNDFIIEGGPDAFVSQKPWGIDLCRHLGLQDHLTGTNPRERASYLLHRGRLHDLPEGMVLLVPTRLGTLIKSPLFTPWGKIRMGLDLLLPRRRATASEESIADFVGRRLGREAVEKLAEPLLAGIHAGDAGRLSLQATFPQFAELEARYRSLILGVLDRKRQRESQSGEASWSLFVTLREGLGELVEVLEKVLREKATIRTGARVRAVRRGLHCAAPPYIVEIEDGATYRADALLLATPAYETAGLLKRILPVAAPHLRTIPYVTTATVSLAYRRADCPHPLNGYGFVVPRKEPCRILASTWTSTKFPHRAPQDHVLLRCFVGGTGREDLALQEEPELVRLAREELKAVLGIAAEPVLARAYRWERANPQYEVGHLTRLEAIDRALEKSPGLFLAGAAYRGVGIPDCIRQGAEAARKAIAFLAGSAGGAAY
ncbi:MAG: protoporphyrinogen oxidase [Nitrospirae bacterium]|nr:protoporphyrinogen oxidase [Nitrospirota bacterium]